MSAYITVDIERCRDRGHHFTMIGSDKHPMKKSMICRECSGDGKTAMVAHGIESGSFGTWRRMPQRETETFNDD